MRGVLAQEIHHRVKNNLQTVASLLRLQARATDGVDPREALEHSVNRILAIAAVHEVLTERRDDDVLLDDLLDRLRAMLVQGIGGAAEARRVGARAGGARRVAGDGAGARLQRAPAERARARRRGRADRARAAERRRRPRDRRLGRRQRASGADGTGLSIVRALVRDELNGRFELRRGEARAPRSSSRPDFAICGKRMTVLHNRYAKGTLVPRGARVRLDGSRRRRLLHRRCGPPPSSGRRATRRRCGDAVAPARRAARGDPAAVRGAGLYALVRPCEERLDVRARRLRTQHARERRSTAAASAARVRDAARARVPLLPACGEQRPHRVRGLRSAWCGSAWTACPWCTKPVGQPAEVAAALSEVA